MDKNIMGLPLFAGYETQQSFIKGIKKQRNKQAKEP